MKWTPWINVAPVLGDYRNTRRFLWLPKCEAGECRWLEWAVLRHKYVYGGSSGDYWLFVGFVHFREDE